MANINLTAGQNITLEQDGNNLIINGEAGGGASSDIVIISDEQPTSEDNKIWIDTGEVQNLGSEVHIGDTINSKIGLNILVGKNLFNGFLVYGYNPVDTATSTSRLRTDYIAVNPNTTYVCSFTATTAGKTPQFYVYEYTDMGQTPTGTSWNGSGTSFTTSSTTKYISLCFRYTDNSNISSSSFSNIQLEKGSTATTYEAYITPTINVDGEDIYSVPKVLWTNPSPTSSFAGQQITLSDSLDNYDYYEVIYYNTTSLTQTFTSGKIKNDKMTTLCYFAGLEANTYIAVRYRTITSVNASQGKITFGDAYNKYVHEQTLTTNNILVIPYKIIGYKE